MRYVRVVSLLVISLNCFGQFNSDYQTGFNVQTSPHSVMTSFAPAPPAKVSSIYIYEEWTRTDVFLIDSTKLVDLSIKIDLKTSKIDIQHKNTVKILPFSKVLALVLKLGTGKNEEYINGSFLFGSQSVYKDQLFQVVFKGKVNLFCKTEVTIIESSNNSLNNPMLNLPKDENKVVLKKKYIIVRGADMVEVEGSKSKIRDDLTKVFGAEAEALVKKANLKNENDLIVLVNGLAGLN